MRISIATTTFGQAGSHPLDRLREVGCEVTVNPYGRPLHPDELEPFVEGSIAVISGVERYTQHVFEATPSLRVISRVGRSLSGIDLGAARRHNVAVYSTPGPLINPVAELTMAGILSAMRRLPAAHAALREGRWERHMGRLLRGQTVGVVGCGRIGRRIVELLDPFEVRVLLCDSEQDREYASTVRCGYYDLDQVLRESDVVSLHLPLSYETWHLIGPEELLQMKPDALLVNTSEANLVDEGALAKHLERRPDFSAYLDVFAEGPYEGPLAGLENSVLTAHMGGYARECRLQMEEEAVESVLRHLGLV